MRIRIVQLSELQGSSLLPRDYIPPTVESGEDVKRAEAAVQTTQATLATVRKRHELNQAQERDLIARGLLIIGE